MDNFEIISVMKFGTYYFNPLVDLLFKVADFEHFYLGLKVSRLLISVK